MIGIFLEGPNWTIQIGVVSPEHWTLVPVFKEFIYNDAILKESFFLCLGIILYENIPTNPTKMEVKFV